jgi:hypothetical protein
MRQFLGLVIIIAVLWAIREGYNRLEESQRQYRQRDNPPAEAAKAPAGLPGFRPGYEAQLEAGLAQARQGGANALRKWLKDYRSFISDPRLAEIELDLVILLGPPNRLEARRILADVGARISPTSPVYERYKKLEKTYQ